MAVRDTIRHVGEILGYGRPHHHWFDERGVPGWTRTEGGYPCLHWADMHIPEAYDRRHELELLRRESEELEGALAAIRARIMELEEIAVNPS